MKDDGGSAFPAFDGDTAFNGMRLRDWFAGQWISGALAGTGFNKGWEQTAELAYKMADAMLEARKK
jgi:hypothetical protein